MKKKIGNKIGFIVITSIVVIVITIIICTRNFVSYDFKGGRNISEVFGQNLELNEKEENITKLLNSLLTEDEQYIGFRKISDDTDLYYANSVCELAATIGNDELLRLIENKMNVISQVNVDTLDVLNLTYYVALCNKFGISYNEAEIIKALEKYYDDKTDLFFMNSEEDTINIKLTITALCCNSISEIKEYEKFEINNGVNRAYENYRFNTDTETTFYNSGGDVIYCMSVLGVLNEEIISNNQEWFNHWRDYYEKIEINSIDTALIYMEFYKIALIFDENYSGEKLQNFYDGLSVEDVAEVTDLYMVNNVLEYVDDLDNLEVNSYLTETINSGITSGMLYQADIDLLETVCAVELARSMDYEIENVKLQNYINSNYNAIGDMELLEDRVNYLYYTIILDELNNNFKISCSADFVQKIVDESLKELKFNDNILTDVVLARKIVEIVSDMQIHNVNVKLTKGQVNKIIKGMEKAVQNENVLSTVVVTDLFILNNIFGTDIIGKEELDDALELLKDNGGVKPYPGNEAKADIYTTHRFFSCYDRIGEYENLEEQKEYVETLKTVDGIYSYTKDGYVSIESVLYGNQIAEFETGGDKNDKIGKGY